MAGDENKEGEGPEFGDRLIVKYEPHGPIEITEFAGSFSALARFYARHFRYDNDLSEVPRLFITKMETGSIIAEISPYITNYGVPLYQLVSAANNVSGFTKRLSDGLKAFAGMETKSVPPVLPSTEDAADLKEFIKPLTGKNKSGLSIRHARFRKKDGNKEILVEYDFDETEINRAAVNIDRALAMGDVLSVELPPSDSSKFLSDVTLIFDRASRAPGKDTGRPTDWTVIPEISDKALPTFFRPSVNGNLKDVMVRGEKNPLTDIAFSVDVFVKLKNGTPTSYVVTDFHSVVSLPRAEDFDDFA
ncbi:MAG TPA: hypothetical protein VGM68_10920 [Rhizomicrobium sp.]|jgi:hypothetical protein